MKTMAAENTEDNDATAKAARGEQAKQAKQLDTLTDHVQEKEYGLNINASKAAAQIVNTLNSQTADSKKTNDNNVLPSMEDVQVVMDELEVTQDVAVGAVKKMMLENSNILQEELQVAALRYLVTR
mmetsp:Transcript_17602/g.27417  ORF Transcript_17602/g.27417 Transcript_17602/m.27417 type:complete len:126 (+) Transcript_17602:8-385(+)